MSARIICINKDGGNHYDPHMGITHFGWKNDDDQQSGVATRSEMIKFIENGGDAYVRDRYGDVARLEVMTRNGVKYVRTIPDRTKADNLLTLTECNR